MTTARDVRDVETYSKNYYYVVLLYFNFKATSREFLMYDFMSGITCFSENEKRDFYDFVSFL